MSDSIIVYRNPLEKALWEGDYATTIVPIIFGLIVFGVVAWVGVTIVDRLRLSYKTQQIAMQGVLVLASIAGLITIWLSRRSK
jgi:hypothetical protein